MYDDLESLNEETDDRDDIKELLENRAAELFRLCDLDEKGFINKQDIQRMREPFGFSPELLEQVFESLDTDKNGFLTLQEFTLGFSKFMEMNQTNEIRTLSFDSDKRILSFHNSNSSINEKELEENDVFEETMQHLGATDLVEKFEFCFFF